MKKTRAICRELTIIEPYKYPVEVGEIIYRFEDGKDIYYLHFDKDDKLLFRTYGFAERVDLNRYTPEGDFEEYFRELINSNQLHEAFAAEFTHLRKMSSRFPIVIGGCGRTGTTLLLSILSAHPNIHAISDETYTFYPKPFRLKRLIRRLLNENYNSGDRWCEKTPKNVQSFGEIYAMFEGYVHLVHIIRDGRDVVTSYHPNSNGEYWVSIERWIQDTIKGLHHQKICHTLKYEDLVKDPLNTLKSLCEYIREPFDNDMLDHIRNTRVKDNIAWFEGAQSLHTKSVSKWNLPEHKERIEEFMNNNHAVELMKQLGYLS